MREAVAGGEIASVGRIIDCSLAEISHAALCHFIFVSIDHQLIVSFFAIGNIENKFSALFENSGGFAEKLNEMILLPARNEFEVFQGKESYVAHEFDLLNQASANCEILIIGGAGDKFSENMGDDQKAYEKLRLAKNISVRYLGSVNQKEYLEKNKKRNLFGYRVLPGLFTGMVNTNIWPEAIGFNIFGEPVTNFTISSAVIAGSYKQFFETLWKLAS